jgi:hypothetical protein
MARKTIGAWIRQALGGHGTGPQRDRDAANRRIGKQVTTSDSVVLGTITAVWQGADATDGAPHEDTLIVQRPEQGVEGLLYIPSHAIARESDQGLILTVEEAQVTARGWRFRPGWLPQEDPRAASTATTSWQRLE